MSIAFLGVGTLAQAMIAGLRRRWPVLPIHLSPRSEAASRALAASDPFITRHDSNAAAVAAADIVVLAMLPPQLDGAVAGMPFRAGQGVISCVAGTALAEVAALVAPATPCRAIPLPMMARGEGPLVLYPALPAALEVLAGQGDVIVAPDEEAFLAYTGGSALMSTVFALQAAMAGVLTAHGVPRDGSALYIRSLLRALAQTAIERADEPLPTLIADHETPGGLNQRVRQHLEARGWFAAIGPALDGVARLRRDALTVAGKD